MLHTGWAILFNATVHTGWANLFNAKNSNYFHTQAIKQMHLPPTKHTVCSSDVWDSCCSSLLLSSSSCPGVWCASTTSCTAVSCPFCSGSTCCTINCCSSNCCEASLILKTPNVKYLLMHRATEVKSCNSLTYRHLGLFGLPGAIWALGINVPHEVMHIHWNIQIKVLNTGNFIEYLLFKLYCE